MVRIQPPKILLPEEKEWNIECERILAEWSERASCYRWLHGRCEKRYRSWYYCFSIPVSPKLSGSV